MHSRRLGNYILSVFVCCLLLFGLCGCYALRKKFIRKPKHERRPEEPVLVFEDYGSGPDRKAAYRKYVLYWRSWQEELIFALERGVSRKKKLRCAQETLSNLKMARSLVGQERQKELDVYLSELESLVGEIKGGHPSGARLAMLRQRLKRNRRNILRVLDKDLK